MCTLDYGCLLNQQDNKIVGKRRGGHRLIHVWEIQLATKYAKQTTNSSW